MGTHPIFESDFDCLTVQIMAKSDGYCAVDCEMVETQNNDNALARVSIVDEECNVLLDRIVIPPGGDIVNHRTRYSGITDKLIKQKGIAFDIVQREVAAIIDKHIVVGHTINNDIEALQLSIKHTIVDIVDLIELRKRYEKVMNVELGSERVGLKRLSAALLMRMIQEGNQGHSSVEDAIATMELFKLVQREFEARCPDLAGANMLDDQFWPSDDDDTDLEFESHHRCEMEEYSEDYI